MWPKHLKWNVAAPLGLLAFVIIAVLWIDLVSGGDAEPPPLLSAVGTPERFAFVAPEATPPGQEGTPRPRPTVTVTGLPGTAAQRDGQRRVDLLLLLDALERVKERDGEYLSTGGNIQTLCAFKELDVGCKLSDVLGRDVPVDPAGDPLKNGYWFQSDGQTVRLYASLEEDIPDEEKCDTDYVDFRDKPNMVCLSAP